jgi:L-cysteine S-thiosulfotransferase
VKWPAGGQYIGDWKAGEKLAQSGRGMTWTDPSAAPKDNGGNCYNCHQLDPKEISHGTIGPSLRQYGKLRGVKDPFDAASAAMVQYTWAKLWNSKAYAACSNMPRFGHVGLLDESQLRDIMALLLDPKSPVNQ